MKEEQENNQKTEQNNKEAEGKGKKRTDKKHRRLKRASVQEVSQTDILQVCKSDQDI